MESAKVVACLLLLCCSFIGALSSKRAISTLPYASFNELTTASGSLDDIQNGTASFVIYLGINEVAEITVTTVEEMQPAFLRTYFYMSGEPIGQRPATSFANGTETYILSYHCPVNPATYFFTLAADSPVSYQLSLKKVNTTTLNRGINTGIYRAVQGYQLAVPVTQNCSALTVTVTADTYSQLNYECYEVSTSRCVIPGAVDIRKDNGVTNTRQTYVSCAGVGTYYLNLRGNGQKRNYTVTVEDAYTCPSWCVGKGICDVSTGSCACSAGLGENCTGVKNTARDVQDTTTIIDIPVNGAPFNYSNPVVVPTGSDMVHVRLVVANPDPTKAIHLVATVQKRVPVEDATKLEFYFNPGVPGTMYNYTSFDSVVHSNGNRDPSIEAYLCAGGSSWYIGISSSYNTDVPIPDIIFTATLVSIGINTSGFMGNLSTVPTTNTTNLAFLQFTAPQNGFAYVSIADVKSNPYLYGIASVQSCGSVNYRTKSQYNDSTTGYKLNYQTIVPITAGLNYYIALTGLPGAGYSGTVKFVSSIVPGCTVFCVSPNGFCNSGGTCICRYGWKGSNCGTPDTGNGALTLASGTESSFQISDQPWSTGSTQVVVLPFVPIGYDLQITISSSMALYVFGPSTTVPNYFTDSYGLYPNGGSKWTTIFNAFQDCAEREATQYYMLFASKEVGGSSGTVSAKLRNAQLTADGTAYNFYDLMRDFNVFHASLPAATCAAKYTVTIKPLEDTNFYDTGGYCGSRVVENKCNAYDTEFECTGDGTQCTAVVPVTKCSYGIDINIWVYNGYNKSASISVVPNKPCPNDCSRNGKCQSDGVCLCNYPYVGLDCASYDKPINTMASRLTTCKGNYSISYGEYIGTSVDSYLCDIYNDDWNVIPNFFNTTKYSYKFTNSCLVELQQIACDLHIYKLQPQASGGSKVVLPCNCRDFLTRCAPGARSSDFTWLTELCSSMNSTLISKNAIYTCNPNPGPLGHADPIPTTSTNNGNGGNTGNVNSSASSLTIYIKLALLLLSILL